MDTTEIQNQAIEIRDAENEGENTALRVGTMLLAIVDAFANIVDMDTLEQILTHYASIPGPGAPISWRNSRCLLLASMGAELDNVDGGNWAYTSHNGDIIFIPDSKSLRVVGEQGDWTVLPQVLYINAHSCHAYKWDSANRKMVEIADSNLPNVITYKNAPAFSQIAIGESYSYQSQSSGPKIAIKISSSETYSFPPDPKKIYAFRDIRQTMLWNPSNQTWVSLTPRVINDLTTGGEGDALSAEMGKLLDERVEALELAGSGGVSVSYNASTKTTNIVVGAGASAETTPTPVISVTDAQDGKQVTITAATGAVIRYTTDGSDPTSSSPVYSSPISINTAGTHTIKAVAKVSGKLMSEVATETFALTGTEQPTITTSETASTVTATATLADATVYISTDGENWTSGSGSASLTINKTTSEQQVTIYAYAKASGMIASQTVTQSVTVAELPNNKLSGTASAALTAITINGTTYTNTQSATDPYIVNTQNGSVYDWEIDFGDTAFGSSIKSGTASKSIFYDGTTDNGNKITKITHMPDSWTSIGTYAFFCANLTQVSYGKNLATISGNYAFYSTKLASVEGLPSTLTSITSNGQSAFKVGESTAGVSVSIPDTVNTLGESAFYNNAKITNIYVGAKTIGDMVFMATSSGALNVVFGTNVSSVGKYIFNSRSNITTIEFLGNPPSFADQSKFLSNGQAIPSGLQIIVPQGMLAAYQSALSSLSSYIEEKSE